MPDEKRKVIIVTDADRVACRTVETAARNIGARCISLSAGNPTPITGEQAVQLVRMAEHDPVVLMVDDRGKRGYGKGEHVLAYVARHPGIEVLGAVAVAANTRFTEGVRVTGSVTRNGEIINGPVDKCGNPECAGHCLLEGDTVDILRQLDIPVIIGTGDTGKMDFADDYTKGAPVTTKALQEILIRSGYKHAGNHGSHPQGQQKV
jgi:stage V sporulation protein AE